MQHFRILTLVDITRTNVFKEWQDPLKKKQQDNFQTLHQTLEIRGNVFYDNDPSIIKMDWSTHGYGESEKTWEWVVYFEQDELFAKDDNPTGLMVDDLDLVPFVAGCDETVVFDNRFFSTKKKPTNITFQIVTK